MRPAIETLYGCSIGICGKIGAGKTTFGAALEQERHVRFFREKRHTPLLDLYVQSPERHGYAFQLVMANDAVNRQEQASEAARKRKLALVERPVLGNRIFACVNRRDGCISDADYAFYERMLPLGVNTGLDAIVYLHVSYPIALERMRNRGDPVEQDYDADGYLARLDDAYFVQMLQSLARREPVIPLIWNDYTRPLQDVLAYVSDVLHRRRTFRFSTQRGDVTLVESETYKHFSWRHYVEASRSERTAYQLRFFEALTSFHDTVLVLDTDESPLSSDSCAIVAT